MFSAPNDSTATKIEALEETMHYEDTKTFEGKKALIQLRPFLKETPN